MYHTGDEKEIEEEADTEVSINLIPVQPLVELEAE